MAPVGLVGLNVAGISVNSTSSSPSREGRQRPFGHQCEQAGGHQAPLQRFSPGHLFCHGSLRVLWLCRLIDESCDQVVFFPLQLQVLFAGGFARETGVHAADPAVASQDDGRGVDGEVDQLR